MGGRLLEWQVLPFGLKCSPRILTRMVRPVVGFLQDKFGILLSTFMDDMLSLAKSRKQAMYEVPVVCLLFMCCGWSLNWSKTVLVPTQTPLHLGFLFNSVDKTIAIPEDKITRLVNWVKSCSSRSGKFGGDFGLGYTSMSFGPTALQSPAKNSTEIFEIW